MASASASQKQIEYIAALVESAMKMPVMTNVITRKVEIENAQEELVSRLGIKSWTWIDEETAVPTWTLNSLEGWREMLASRINEIQESVTDTATASVAISALKKILGRK